MTKSRYPLHQSPLYKIVGIGRLEAVLGIKVNKLNRLLALENYRVWINAKGREIQQPIRWLAQVHQRIGGLLARIELPDYVFSQKGRSYADNAWYHVGDVPLGKTDISGFYSSTTRQMVWRMFSHDFKCANDVADILADICCYRQAHLPTGSSLSSRIAYFAAKSAFDTIAAKAKAAGTRMSLYVDDITLSGSGFSMELLADVRQIVRQHGLKTKTTKTKTFAASAPKMVTGAIIVGNEIRLPNERHRKISDVRKALRQASPADRSVLQRSLRGRMQEAKQILIKNSGKAEAGEP
jgi:hypothetical protein